MDHCRSNIGGLRIPATSAALTPMTCVRWRRAPSLHFVGITVLPATKDADSRNCRAALLVGAVAPGGYGSCFNVAELERKPLMCA